MTNQSFILFLAASRWSICTGKIDPNPTVEMPFASGYSSEQIAEDVRDALKSAGHTNSPICICIASTFCISASIDVTDLPRNESRAMLYRMEESLPVAAEAVVADFIVSGDTALGVCARIDTVAPLVTALEALGIVVQSITSTVLAASQSFASTKTDEQIILLMKEPLGDDVEFANILQIKNGLITNWSLVPATVSDLKLQLDLLAGESATAPVIYTIDMNPQIVTQLTSLTGQMIEPIDSNAISLARDFATLLLTNGAKPWAEFRRDQLAAEDPLRFHRKWIDAALAAGITLMLSIAVACLVRGYRYQQSDQQNTRMMVAAFQQHFPTREIPIDVRTIVDAEYRRATGIGNALASSGLSASALITFHDVLVPLMAQDRFQISRMAFHQNAFEITGRIPSYEQLDALCKSARVDGMVVTPAQTRKEADGNWTFTLQGAKPATPSSN